MPLDRVLGITPNPKTPKGKIQWREIKVGLLVRLSHRITRAGKQVTRLCRRRLVAVLGDVDTFIPRIHLEAQLQSYACAPQVIWLSDGGRGFWRVYRQCFADCAIGILDFYHAAVALLYTTTTGMTVQIHGLRTTVDPHWRRGLSYLKIGLRCLDSLTRRETRRARVAIFVV
jgi:hypothetical protein